MQSTQSPQHRKPKWLIVAANVRHNLTARWNLARGRVDSDIGSTHRGLSTDKSVAYINRVFDDYLAYGGIDREFLEGKRILELGPGDNLGVALRLYAAGAAQVVCLDKFFSRRDPVQQRAIYQGLRQHLSPVEQARYEHALRSGDETGIDPQCVKYVWGNAAESADKVLGAESFDLVVSRAVLWEIHEIDQTLAALDRVLKPGGMMIHKIALLDWMFTQDGYHPLEFLTVPEFLYRWMARDSGKSNRRTIDYYRRVMQQMGYDTQFHITQVVGMENREFPPGTQQLQSDVHYDASTLGLLQEIRPRLQPEFQRLDDEDLMVRDMFVVARKSASNSGHSRHADA